MFGVCKYNHLYSMLYKCLTSLSSPSSLVNCCIGNPEDEEGAEARDQLERCQPYLRDRLEYIEQSGRALELEEEVEDIRNYLEIIDDPDVVRYFIIEHDWIGPLVNHSKLIWLMK